MNHTHCREIYNCGSLKPFNEVTHHPCGRTLDITGRLEEGECHRKYPCSANSLENQASLLLSFVKVLSTAEFCSLIVQHLYILLLNEKEKKKRSAEVHVFNKTFHSTTLLAVLQKLKAIALYCVVFSNLAITLLWSSQTICKARKFGYIEASTSVVLILNY